MPPFLRQLPKNQVTDVTVHAIRSIKLSTKMFYSRYRLSISMCMWKRDIQYHILHGYP